MKKRLGDDQGEYIKAVAFRALGALYYEQRLFEGEDVMGVTLLQASVQGPFKTGGDYRCILKGRDEAGKLWVSFVNGNTLEELHNNIKAVGETNGFKWREDKPFPKPE